MYICVWECFSWTFFFHLNFNLVFELKQKAKWRKYWKKLLLWVDAKWSNGMGAYYANVVYSALHQSELKIRRRNIIFLLFWSRNNFLFYFHFFKFIDGPKMSEHKHTSLVGYKYQLLKRQSISKNEKNFCFCRRYKYQSRTVGSEV